MQYRHMLIVTMTPEKILRAKADFKNSRVFNGLFF